MEEEMKFEVLDQKEPKDVSKKGEVVRQNFSIRTKEMLKVSHLLTNSVWQKHGGGISEN